MITPLKKCSAGHQYSAKVLFADHQSQSTRRIYSTSVLETAIGKFNARAQVAPILGEPETFNRFEDDGSKKIDLTRVSHKVIDCRLVPPTPPTPPFIYSALEVTIETLATPMGIALKPLLDIGALYLYMIGTGTVHDNVGGGGTVDDLEFITFDIVSANSLGANLDHLLAIHDIPKVEKRGYVTPSLEALGDLLNFSDHDLRIERIHADQDGMVRIDLIGTGLPEEIPDGSRLHLSYEKDYTRVGPQVLAVIRSHSDQN